jgi:hypothetical protein
MTQIPPKPIVTELNDRSREIFRLIVDAYVETGEPVGSRTLARKGGLDLSPATIRNVMADLEEQGLLFAPHTSAGRLPTEAGLKLFVNGLLELGGLSEDERRNIEGRCAAAGKSLSQALEEATSALAGLSRCAGLVISPKIERPLRHIEFVPLAPGRALVVMVTEDGVVENRIIDVPAGTLPSTTVAAGNYLNARLSSTRSRPGAAKSTSSPPSWSPRASLPGPVDRRTARSSSRARRSCWTTSPRWAIWNGCARCSTCSRPRRRWCGSWTRRAAARACTSISAPTIRSSAWRDAR